MRSILTCLALFAAPPAAAEPSPQARCLVAAYPDFLCGADATAVRRCDGVSIPWDDGRAKDDWTRFTEPDLEDMFFEQYPAAGAWPPAPVTDPGRVRYEPLFEHMYGATADAVRAKLVPVRWFGTTVRVTNVNGVAERLRLVARDLERLPARHRRFFTETAGTFAWRPIAGSPMRSLHSYAIAIDVGVKHSDYWRWVPGATKSPAPPPYRNRFPREVVDAFERHGFIWGGRWAHFDTMHFEFRPELLCARAK
jgi:hypothetical protein